MAYNNVALYWILSVVACLFAHALWRRKSSKCIATAKKLPPGPRGLPLVGNLFDIPSKSPWRTFAAWEKTYGDVVYLKVLGRPIIILNTVEATANLLEGRFSIYSDRPRFPLMDLVGHQWNFGLASYGTHWRTHKRMFGERYSMPKSLRSFYPAHQTSVSGFLYNILRDPDNFSEHLKLKSGQLIMDVTYGIRVESPVDPLIQTVERVMDVTSLALSPAMWLINPSALMQFVPKWLGGSSVSLRLKQWRQDLEDLRNIPFDMAKQNLRNGTARPSYAVGLLQELTPLEGSEEEATIRDTSAIAFGAALETTIISGEVFLLALALYPHTQELAQKEIDEIVGEHRLPTFSDREKLPYTSAVAKEVLRWHPPAPTGIPHQLKEDDVYRGMLMPKGSVVMGNIWGILHNPSLYPDPSVFKPERFLQDGVFDCAGNDPSRYVFGFGRRVCPGRSLSEDALWLTVAQFLAVFTVRIPENEPPPKVEFVSGAISKPAPFKCTIVPRSTAARHLIEAACE